MSLRQCLQFLCDIEAAVADTLKCGRNENMQNDMAVDKLNVSTASQVQTLKDKELELNSMIAQLQERLSSLETFIIEAPMPHFQKINEAIRFVLNRPRWYPRERG